MRDPVTETLTIDDIRKLMKKFLGLSVGRATIYNYIKTRGFPANMGIGLPRIWRKAEVYEWFEAQRTPKA